MKLSVCMSLYRTSQHSMVQQIYSHKSHMCFCIVIVFYMYNYIFFQIPLLIYEVVCCCIFKLWTLPFNSLIPLQNKYIWILSANTISTKIKEKLYIIDFSSVLHYEWNQVVSEAAGLVVFGFFILHIHHKGCLFCFISYMQQKRLLLGIRFVLELQNRISHGWNKKF